MRAASTRPAHSSVLSALAVVTCVDHAFVVQKHFSTSRWGMGCILLEQEALVYKRPSQGTAHLLCCRAARKAVASAAKPTAALLRFLLGVALLSTPSASAPAAEPARSAEAAGTAESGPPPGVSGVASGMRNVQRNSESSAFQNARCLHP